MPLISTRPASHRDVSVGRLKETCLVALDCYFMYKESASLNTVGAAAE